MSTFFVNQSYSDFDEYNEAVKAWDLEFLQLGHGQFRADVLQFGDEELLVGKVQYNKLLQQNGSAPLRGYTFAVHHDQSAPFLWRYQDFGFNSIIVFPDNRELHGVSQPGHHPFIITVSEELLTKTSCALGLPAPDKFILKGSVSSCDPAHILKLQDFLKYLCDNMTETLGRFSNLLMNDASKWHLTSLLVLSLANSKFIKPKKRNFGNRRRVVERILEYIQSDLSSPRSIAQLCGVAEVDERTLRNMFYERFSVSPQKLIKSYRLNAVRSTLRQRDPSQTKVSDVANLYGFWHLGQFAKDYFRQFGELPSKTIFRS